MFAHGLGTEMGLFNDFRGAYPLKGVGRLNIGAYTL